MNIKTKKIFIGILLLLLLLPVLTVLLTLQPFFWKAVIVPRIETATDSQIEIENLSFAPLRSLSLSELEFRKNDGSLNLAAPSVLVRYDLMKILKGTVWIDELSITSPNIVYHSPSPSSAESPEEASGSGTAMEKSIPQLHIQNVSVTDGDFTLQQPDNFLKLEGLNLSVPEIRNGQDLRASLRTRLYGEQVTSETLHRLNGQINGTLDLTLSPELLPQSLAMTAQSTLESPDSEIPAMDFKLETRTELDLQNQKISVHSLFAQALQGDAPILQVELDQALHVNYQQLPPQISDAALTLSVPPLQIKDLPFAPWIPLKKGEISLQSTWEVSDSGRRLQAKIDFATQQLEIPAEKTSQTITLDQAEGSVGIFWTTGKDPQVEATLHTRYIQLQDGIRLPSPLKIGLKGSGSLTGATLEKAEIQWQQIPGFENRLTVSGSADWTVRDAMNVEMYLSAQSLELNSWKDFLIQKPQPDPSGSEPGPGRETDSTSAWKLPTLPFEKLMLDVEIGKVHFSEVMLQAVRLKLDAEKQSLILQPFSLVLNQSEINQTLNLDWTNGIHVTTEASISPLDLQPVIDSFYPEKRGVIMGMLQGSTAFSTNGTSGESMRRNLSGQLDLSYTQGKIRLLDSNPDQQTALFHTRKLVQDIVTALAGALNLSPEKLMAPEIESVILSSRIKDQHLQLERGRIENPEFLMEMQGEIALSPVVGDSELDSIPVILGVSTNLAKRIKIYREDRLRDQYIVLPAFLQVRGTLAEPEIDVKKSVITGLIISGVTERNQLGNQNIQEGLEILGSILTGEPVPQKTPSPESAPSPNATPVNTPKPDKTEMILDGIKLFQQLRATPTPAP